MGVKQEPRYPESGRFLRKLREDRRIDPKTAAIGVKERLKTLPRSRRGGSVSGLWRYENGEQLPGPEVLWALSVIYDEPINNLLRGVYDLPLTFPNADPAAQVIVLSRLWGLIHRIASLKRTDLPGLLDTIDNYVEERRRPESSGARPRRLRDAGDGEREERL
jgi:transcriptional regulator with XRE-family HTH domain